MYFIDPETALDVSYCFLKCQQSKSDVTLPQKDILATISGGIVKVIHNGNEIPSDEIENAMTSLPNYLSIADYPRVISLGPNLDLIKILLTQCNPFILKVLSSIRHHEISHPQTKRIGCCALHVSISRLLSDAHMQMIVDYVSSGKVEAEEMKKIIICYGGGLDLIYRQKLFVQICETGLIRDFEVIHCMVTKDLFKDKNLQYCLNTMDVASYLSDHLFSKTLRDLPKNILFIINRLPSNIRERISDNFFKDFELNGRLEEDWWRISAILSKDDKMFFRLTTNDSSLVDFYRCYFERIIKSSKSLWPLLIQKLIYPSDLLQPPEFSIELAQLLFTDEKSQKIMATIIGRRSFYLIPFLHFPKEYLRFALLRTRYFTGLLTFLAANDSRYFGILSKLIFHFLRVVTFAELDYVLNFELSDRIIPTHIEAFCNGDSQDLFILCNVLDISALTWRLIFYDSKVKIERANESDYKYLFLTIATAGEHADIDSRELEIFTRVICRKDTDVVPLIFSPELCPEFRYYLFGEYRIRPVLNSYQLYFPPMVGDSSDPEFPIQQEILAQLNDGGDWWLVLMKFPLGALLGIQKFWERIDEGLFSIPDENENCREFCKIEPGKLHLILSFLELIFTATNQEDLLK